LAQLKKLKIVSYQSLGLLSEANQIETTGRGGREANSKRKGFQLNQKRLKNQNNQTPNRTSGNKTVINNNFFSLTWIKKVK